jgi:dienelactone hydrolase
MRSLAQAFAANGLTALIPYYLEKTATSPGNPVLQSMFGHRAAWQQALADAVALAETDRVALVGFSLGGHLSLRLRGVVPVVVEFFAPLLDGIGPLPPTGAHCQVQIHHGEADGLVDITNAERIAHLLEEEGAEVDVWRYEDAGHGFGGRKAGDAAALKASMTRAVEFTTACLARNLTR